jgi:predicted DNA-binding protein (MmcQ/YjbR family)
MNVEELRDYCLSKKGAEECFPFDDVTLVVKVGGKMFALINLDGELSINLKCDPDKAQELRETYNSITPGYHMNKKLWNTVFIDNTISNKLIKELIDHSYTLVYNSLPKKVKNNIL